MARELTQAPESLFWYWISERHSIYLRRQRGESKPWTTDPILRDYKFTNPFRENDRGTVWLRENFLEPHRAPVHLNCAMDWKTGIGCDCGVDQENLSLLAFNICWYRMFNWTGTGELLGWRESWPSDEIKELLTSTLAEGKQVFTGAHIVYSPPGFSKIDAIVDVCSALWALCRGSLRDISLVQVARETKSLEAVFNLLTTVHCVGGFMAYEMVTDMRHTRLLEDATDIMTWANPGPGARRGLQRLGLPYKGSTAIRSMRRLLQEDIEARQSDGAPLDFPPLEMRGIEHSLCEFDKYCRVKFGEGEPRSKYPGGA